MVEFRLFLDSVFQPRFFLLCRWDEMQAAQAGHL